MSDEADKVYEAIELAKSTGKLKKGTNEVTKSIERGTAKLVAIAKDVSPPEITMHIPLLSKEMGITCLTVPSKEELGSAAGLEVGTGSVAIVQEGEAKQLVNELAKSVEKPEEKAPAEEGKPEEETPAEKKPAKDKPDKEEKPKKEGKKKEKAEKKKDKAKKEAPKKAE
jgi:large subunit ribosomal protein L7Ae